MRFAEKTILSAALILLVVLISATVVVHKLTRSPQPVVALSEPTATPYAIPTPSPTPDCSVQIDDYMSNYLPPVLDEWQDAVDLADSSPRITLPTQIAGLQKLRREVDKVEPDPCVLYAHALLVNAMDETVSGFMAFLSQEPDRVVSKHFESATVALDALSREMNILPTPVPSTGGA